MTEQGKGPRRTGRGVQDTAVTSATEATQDTLLQAEDLYLFARGEQECAYRFLGANPRHHAGQDGVLFAVWAPNARAVSVVGDFNHWNPQAHPLRRHAGFGVWEVFIPGVQAGQHYKYQIISAQGVVQPWKADPYARATQLRPDTASIVPAVSQHQWQDADWLARRAAAAPHGAPMLIYEVHAGSWRRHWHDDSFLSYRELAEQLVAYVKDMGFTHIQFMPLSEFPFDGSWGYQPIGLYSPTSRFGAPDELLEQPATARIGHARLRKHQPATAAEHAAYAGHRVRQQQRLLGRARPDSALHRGGGRRGEGEPRGRL